jgi:hypothetical protein
MITSPRASTAVRTYARTSYSNAIVCSARPTTQLYVNDRSRWETFDSSDLCDYLTEGAEKAAASIERIAYLGQPYTTQDEQDLVFMVEALLHARRAADESIHAH